MLRLVARVAGQPRRDARPSRRRVHRCIGAPVIEEAAKGLFLLIMMTGRRRNELNSLTDCLVYAGLVGAGFAWLEDILYIANGETLADSLLTAALRLIMAPFAHSLFTTMPARRVVRAAEAQHARQDGLHPARLCRRGDHARAVERLVGDGRRGVFRRLPVVDGAGLRAGDHARRQRVGAGSSGSSPRNCPAWWPPAWSPRTRRAGWDRSAPASWRSPRPRGSAGKRAGKAVKTFARQVVELAFVRDRIDRGFGDERVQALLNEEAYGVHAAREAAPTLQWLAGYRTPGV